MTNTNLNTKVAFLEETNYAGGDAGEKYDATAVTDGEDTGLTMFSFLAADVALLGKKIKKERYAGPTTNGTSRLTVITGVEYPEITIEQYIQDDYWFKVANGEFGEMTATTEEGASWLIHVELPDSSTGTMEAHDLVGCRLKKYEFSATPGSPPTEKLTFICYDQVDGNVCNTDTSLVFDEDTLPKVWSNVALTVDGDTITELTELNYTLTNTFTNEQADRNKATSFRPLDRKFLLKEIEVQFKSQSDDAAIVKDILTETAAFSSYTVVVNAGYTVTASITNMDVDTSNFGSFSNEPSEFEYNVTLKQGDSAITVS